MGEIQRFFGGIYRGFLRGGGDIEVFFGGGNKVLRGKNPRVQSPESRVQGPGSSPAFRICLSKLHEPIGECNLRSFKTLRVPINH